MMDVSVLFEDNHLLVLNKPAGVLVHGDKTGDQGLDQWAKQYLKKKYHKPGNVFLGVCHRLDRPVSGVLIFARTSKALARLNEQFRDQKVTKTYLAISHQSTKYRTNSVRQYLHKNIHKNIVHHVSKWHKDGKLALTQYELIHSVQDYFLYDLRPETGRPHQLRVALASEGAPILGDLKYGGAKIDDSRRILLHGWSLTFLHPTKRIETTIKAPLPDHPIWNLFRSMI